MKKMYTSNPEADGETVNSTKMVTMDDKKRIEHLEDRVRQLSEQANKRLTSCPF